MQRQGKEGEDAKKANGRGRKWIEDTGGERRGKKQRGNTAWEKWKNKRWKLSGRTWVIEYPNCASAATEDGKQNLSSGFTEMRSTVFVKASECNMTKRGKREQDISGKQNTNPTLLRGQLTMCTQMRIMYHLDTTRRQIIVGTLSLTRYSTHPRKHTLTKTTSLCVSSWCNPWT